MTDVQPSIDSPARSVLLTALGEFVLPAGGSAWTSSLLAALATVEVGERATRQAILRADRAGWLTTEKVGRRARCHLTGDSTRLLQDGAERIYSFGSVRHRQPTEWLVVVASTEPARAARHRLRTRLAWHGLANLAPGVWITPDADREGAVVDELAALGLEGLTFLGRAGSLGIDQETISRLWDLERLALQYRTFIDRFGQRAPSEEDETVGALIDLVHQWRRFPFSDPQLPSDLLPVNWPGPEAAAVFARQRATWSDTANQWWQHHEHHAAA